MTSIYFFQNSVIILIKAIVKFEIGYKAIYAKTDRNDFYHIPENLKAYGEQIPGKEDWTLGFPNIRHFVQHRESDRANRRVLRRIGSLSVVEVPPQLMMGDVAHVIRNAKLSKALGSDGTSMVMLNLSLATHIVIETWKMGWVCF